MEKVIVVISLAVFIALSSSAQSDIKATKSAHINFFSHTSVEDISADNYAVTSTIAPSSGIVVFSVPMQSFKFEKALMQKHFNNPDFLDTKQFSKAKFKGVINNLEEIDFSKDGKYVASCSGELTIHGVQKEVTQNGTITVSGGSFILDLQMKVVLADYNIALKDGKPSNNVANEIDVTVKAEYK
ncbi:MAG: YceI family protein [Cryomorphaceae bacterium]|nr:YceI family protein [Cryomorphaceae bacterium]